MMDVTLDDGNEQYGVSIAAKCDIGVGQVKKKLAYSYITFCSNTNSILLQNVI